MNDLDALALLMIIARIGGDKMDKQMKLTQKMKDILLAGAIGDAVGYFIEFSKLSRIKALYGEDGLTLEALNPKTQLVVSDDTQMTLFALEAIIEHGENITDRKLFEKYRSWYLTQYNPNNEKIDSVLGNYGCMQHQRAPGGTCLSALARAYQSIYGTEFLNDSKGCGAVMRAAPFGFYPCMEDSLCLGKIQGQVTHRHPTGYLSGALMACLINYALYHKTDLLEALEFCSKYVQKEYPKDSDETLDVVMLAIKLGMSVMIQSKPIELSTHEENIKTIGEGWVGDEALAIAIYCALVSHSFEEVIKLSINHDGDSDSTGSIAAQLWVAFNDLPEEYQAWVDRLDIKNAFKHMIEDQDTIKHKAADLIENMTPEKAQDLLQNAGIVDENGNITTAYGGNYDPNDPLYRD